MKVTDHGQVFWWRSVYFHNASATEGERASALNELFNSSFTNRPQHEAGWPGLALLHTCECVSAVTAPPKTHSRQTASLSLSGAALCHITSSQRTRAPFACHYRDGNNWLKVTCRELLGRSHSSLPAGFVCLCVRVGWIFKVGLYSWLATFALWKCAMIDEPSSSLT